MRRLHAVGIREKFWASGVYEPSDPQRTSRQQWTIHGVGEGAWLVRVDETFADHFTLHEAFIEPDDLFARYTQEIFFAGKPRHKHNFILEEEGLVYTWSTGGKTHDESVACPHETVLLCPTWILQGLAWKSLLNHAHRGFYDVFGKEWQPSPMFSTSDELLVLGNKTVTSQKVQWNSVALWLDPHGIALKIHDDGNDYDLTQFALAR